MDRNLKQIIEDYRKAEHTEEWDEFYNSYRMDIDELLDYLIMLIEKEVDNDRT